MSCQESGMRVDSKWRPLSCVQSSHNLEPACVRVRVCMRAVEMQALISKLVLLLAEPSPRLIFRTDSPFSEQLISGQQWIDHRPMTAVSQNSVSSVFSRKPLASQLSPGLGLLRLVIGNYLLIALSTCGLVTSPRCHQVSFQSQR